MENEERESTAGREDGVSGGNGERWREKERGIEKERKRER